MKNISDKSCSEYQNTRFIFNKDFFSEYYAINEIMGKSIAERCSPQMIRPMRIACCVPKATNTLSEYVILVALPLQFGCAVAPQCYIICIMCVFYMHSGLPSPLMGE